MDRLKPLNDFIFKKLFGENEAKHNLIAFLNAVLDRKDKDRLVSLEIIENKELTKEMMEDKTGILDVRARTEDGTQINIEVQLTDQRNMDKRTLFYWGRLFNEGIRKGEDYRKLCKVITINILDFEYLSLNKFHSKFHLWEDEEKDYMLTDLVEIHFIEVPKFNELDEKNLKEDKLQRWLTFFNKDISEETLKELMDMDEDIKRAEERLEYLSSDKKTIELYKAREKSLHERENMINSAKEEGREEGREQEKIKIAKSLLDILDVETIALKTGLSIQKVKSLKN
ncbi:MAG: Rpn family recombination-promoting nuclease/putative transposase [Tepidibacter sp.]|uniref:Rpn family recombination-promoting nuclease/putative transposase n=1 Tax=Tepidibacter sp. TaxID=2529387 RepID=UPI0025D3FFEC|nr:Rpn family recombination-promoting nuclease/putative transposase [Tepidibacter sp.]MCT4509721.1 Rpn family recombination-promoting nuclease/putative transposase [Tepidibacter sp.]MCT4584782.1 Rpn family recombination-promoting nuclease/putative transposase [Peptostreptococcaceae bacterium]